MGSCKRTPLPIWAATLYEIVYARKPGRPKYIKLYMPDNKGDSDI